jgi:glycosyltransferase involved in cell wall biosynthesis
MRIAFILHSPADPKTAVFAYAAARGAYLEARGHRVEIRTHDDEPALARIAPRWWPFAFPLRIARRLAQDPPDVAIFHSYTGWAYHALRRFRPSLRRVRTIVQFHGVETLHYRAMRAEEKRRGRDFSLKHRLLQTLAMPLLLRLSCHGASRVFCLNRAEAEFLAARGWARRERIEILPNAAPDELLAEPPGDRSRPVRRLLFVGQWLEGKGIRYLAAAVAAVVAERPGLILDCVGTRASVEKVREAFPAAVRDRVTVKADADRAEIKNAFRDADLFVFPSLSEGSSLALLEAMATGLPIVTTPVGAAPDLLADGVSALFIPVADAAALAGAVRRLLGDSALRVRLGMAARAIAEEYAWPRLSEDFARRIEQSEGGK